MTISNQTGLRIEGPQYIYETIFRFERYWRVANSLVMRLYITWSVYSKDLKFFEEGVGVFIKEESSLLPPFKNHSSR